MTIKWLKSKFRTVASAALGSMLPTSFWHYLFRTIAIFLLSSAASGASFRVIHTFGGDEGANPLGGLTLGKDGNFYGTTQNGGRAGTVFQMTSAGKVTTLYKFSGAADGAFPAAAVTFDSVGNLYGSTLNGGGSGLGTLFRLTTNNVFTRLHTFSGLGDGENPQAALTLGKDGNFYGVCYPQLGSIFRITPGGIFTSLYSFTGGADSGYPNGLTTGSDGNLYGTAAVE
jgi:uncharacterized repeat protein (TIGR03803 family)